MANTVNLGKATRATAGRGDRRFGGRFYRAIGLAAIALVALGLATGATINRMRPAAVQDTATAPPVNPYWVYTEEVPTDAPHSVYGPFVSDPHVYTQWDFREDRRDDGSAVQLPGPVAPAGAADWEQQERGQVAPGTVPTSPTILPGDCQAGTSDCPPTVYYSPIDPTTAPTAPTILPGDCQPGTSDCPPKEYSSPGGPPPADYPGNGPR
jgi:hypothetical protein